MDPERWRQVGELLHRALAIAPGQRQSYLESACGGNAELRAEVESLLAASGRPDLILDKPVFDLSESRVMDIAPGQTIEQYEILERIGEGGMGMVFKARDQKLGRIVALKTLHPRIGSSPDGRRRFVQEARAASALNRPNIITIYDLLEHNGAEIIVMEYVEGRSLEQMLASRAIPLPLLYKIGIQVADALAAAHAAGIVHRDLKPANILVGTDGLVKVVDFGVAKLTETAAVAPTAQTQTISGAEPTQGGMIVGTAAYMSPEQAESQPVDARSDIFSFGSVLYEMATGRRAFSGESVLSTLSAVLRDEPTPVREIMPTVPAELARIVSRCLRKDPARRFQGMADLRVALEDCRDDAEAARSSGTAAAVVTPRRSVRPWATAALVATGIALGAISAYLLFGPVNVPAARMRPLVTETSQSESPSWSPDGKVLAYVARSDSDSRLMARAVDAATPAQLAVARGTLFNLVWSRDATRIFYLSRSRMATPALWSVGAAGGASRKERDLVAAADLSPDGRTFAMVETHGTHGELWLGALDGPGRHRYRAGPFDDSWSFLAGAGAGQLWVRFAPDGSKLLVTFTPIGTGEEQGAGTLHSEIWIIRYPAGSPRRVLSTFLGSGTLHDVQWMQDSRHLVLTLVGEAGFPHIFLADSRSGWGIPLTSTPLAESELAVRPDGKSIAFESVTGSADLIEVPLDGGPARPLLDSAMLEEAGAWAPDGLTYAYVLGSGRPEIWLRRTVEGWARPLVRIGEGGLPDATRALRSIRFSPDGNRILFTVIENKHQIYIAPVAGGKPVPLDPGNHDQHYADWSPDGEWIVYTRRTNGPPVQDQLVKVSSGGGQPAVVADNVPVTAIPVWSPLGEWIAYTARGVHLVSPDGARHKVFSDLVCRDIGFARDGHSLYCITPAHGVLSVDIASGGSRKLVDVPLPSGASLEGFSLHPKSASFLTTLLRVKSDIWVLEDFPTGIPGPARVFPWLFAKP